MKIDFNLLDDNSKIWIYQAEHSLNVDQIESIKATLDVFCESWEAHGAPLKASYEIINNQFFIIAVDEGMNAASGCSIDKSVAIFKQLEEKLHISLLEKSNVAYQNNDRIQMVNFRNIKENIQSDEIMPDTKVFDLTLTTLKEYRLGWPKAAKNTWLNRFFGVKTVS